MTTPIIAVDIDDVLSRTADNIIRYGNEHWGFTHTLEDFSEDFQKMWQVNHAEAERRWREFMGSEAIEQYGVIPEAKVVLEHLKDGFRLIAVTSRRATLMPITEDWLAANYACIFEEAISAKMYDQDQYAPHKITKAEVLQRIKAEYLIDDQIKHCEGAVSSGVKAILFGDYPWNRASNLPEGITRCKDWAEVERYFDGRAD